MRASFEGNRKDRLAVHEVTRVCGGQILKERMDGCQAYIASRHAIVSSLLEMIQEAANRFGTQIFQGQICAILLMMSGGKLQKQLHRVPISQDGYDHSDLSGRQDVAQKSCEWKAQG